MKYVAIGIAALAALLGLGWIVQGNDFFLYAVFAPKYEQVRRNTFEQSRAFNEGMAQELQRMWLDYQHATNPEEKAAIRSLVQHRVAGYDTDNIGNTQLRAFVRLMLQGG